MPDIGRPDVWDGQGTAGFAGQSDSVEIPLILERRGLRTDGERHACVGQNGSIRRVTCDGRHDAGILRELSLQEKRAGFLPVPIHGDLIFRACQGAETDPAGDKGQVIVVISNGQ